MCGTSLFQQLVVTIPGAKGEALFRAKNQARQIEQEKMETAWNMLREHVPADIMQQMHGTQPRGGGAAA